MEIINSPTTTWSAKMACVITCIYVCFVVSCFAVPESIPCGPSLAFAYTFTMLQMVEVAIFLRVDSIQNTLFAAISLLVGCVVPTVHILTAMEHGIHGQYVDNVCGHIYFLKELVVYVIIRRRSRMPLIRRTHVTTMLLWVVVEILFHVFIVRIAEDFHYEIPIRSLASLIRSTPVFILSFVTIKSIEYHVVSNSDTTPTCVV